MHLTAWSVLQWLIAILYKQSCAYIIVQLLEVFQGYTKAYPSLGMTVEEFQEFLIKYQRVRISSVCS